MFASERALAALRPTPSFEVGTAGGLSEHDGGFIREGTGTFSGGFQRETNTNGCSMCPNLTVDPEFWETFKVRTCRQCKRSADMELISKGKAKQMYLLTDKDIANAGLGSLVRENPQKKTWSQMKLYLKKQVSCQHL